MQADPLEKVRIKKRIEQAQESQLAGDFDAARSVYEEVLVQHADQPLAMRGLGILSVQQGRLDEAENWLRKAIETEPGNARNWNDLGEAFRLGGRADEAVKAYHRALELQPELVEAMNNLAVVLAGQGEFDEAQRWLNAGIAAVPEDPYPYNNLGVILEAVGDLDGALRNYEVAVLRKSDFLEAKENYASLLARQPDRVMDSMTRLLEQAKRLE